MNEIFDSRTANDTQAAVVAGIIGAGPQELPEDRFSTVIQPAGSQVVILDRDELSDRHLDFPKRKRGKYSVHNAESFLAYIDKHGSESSEVWADEARQKLVGVIDAHADGMADWEEHRVELELVHSIAWKTWIESNNKLLPQTQFAELIEARSIDVKSPTAADMLELAETFQAKSGVEFKSSQILQSGERQFQYVENTIASAGKKDQLTIPKQFVLGLQPFVGGQGYEVNARFRYRITSGDLFLGYTLERPEDVLKDAFDEYVHAVISGLDGTPVYFGHTA